MTDQVQNFDFVSCCCFELGDCTQMIPWGWVILNTVPPRALATDSFCRNSPVSELSTQIGTPDGTVYLTGIRGVLHATLSAGSIQ